MQDFAEHSADLVNTLTGKTVPKQPLRWFWEGFNSVSQRLVDSQARANIRMWAQVISPPTCIESELIVHSHSTPS